MQSCFSGEILCKLMWSSFISRTRVHPLGCFPCSSSSSSSRLLVDSHLECWSGELVGCLAPCPPYLLPAAHPLAAKPVPKLGQSERFTDLVLWARTILEHSVDSSVLPAARLGFLNSSAAASSSNPINRLVITNQKLLLLRLNGFYTPLSLSLSLLHYLSLSFPSSPFFCVNNVIAVLITFLLWLESKFV